MYWKNIIIIYHLYTFYILKHLLLNVCLVHVKGESLYRNSMFLNSIRVILNITADILFISFWMLQLNAVRVILNITTQILVVSFWILDVAQILLILFWILQLKYCSIQLEYYSSNTVHFILNITAQILFESSCILQFKYCSLQVQQMNQ